MKGIRTALLAIGATLLLGACAAGRDFVRPSAEELRIGVTTRDEIVKRYGEPSRTASVVMNGESVSVVNYAYASLAAEAFHPGVTGARSASFHFWDGKLVGHQFVSSMKADASYFAKDKAAQVKQGMERAQVLALMGEPSGRMVYPLVEVRDGEGLVYNYTEVRGFTPHRRVLEVVLDRQGRVVKSTFVADGDSPLP